jgi:hypothetical protein
LLRLDALVQELRRQPIAGRIVPDKDIDQTYPNHRRPGGIANESKHSDEHIAIPKRHRSATKLTQLDGIRRGQLLPACSQRGPAGQIAPSNERARFVVSFVRWSSAKGSCQLSAIRSYGCA